MDRQLGNPAKDEKFRLIPLSTMLPEQILPVYRALMKYAQDNSSESSREDIQGIIWAMREVASHSNINRPLSLSDQQQSLLEKVYPGGTKIIADYQQNIQSAEAAKEKIGGLIDKSLNRRPSMHLYDTITRNEAHNNIRQTLTGIRNTQGKGYPAVNGEYTLLMPNIAARTTSPNGGSKEVLVEIVNNSNEAFAFDPTDYVAQSQRQVQRLALHPAKHNEGINDEDFADINSLLKRSDVTTLESAMNPATKSFLLNIVKRLQPGLADKWGSGNTKSQ